MDTTTSTAQYEVYFTTTRKGQPRAYRFDRQLHRVFPMGHDAAKLAVATGAAREIFTHPTTGASLR